MNLFDRAVFQRKFDFGDAAVALAAAGVYPVRIRKCAFFPGFAGAVVCSGFFSVTAAGVVSALPVAAFASAFRTASINPAELKVAPETASTLVLCAAMMFCSSAEAFCR